MCVCVSVCVCVCERERAGSDRVCVRHAGARAGSHRVCARVCVCETRWSESRV